MLSVPPVRDKLDDFDLFEAFNANDWVQRVDETFGSLLQPFLLSDVNNAYNTPEAASNDHMRAGYGVPSTMSRGQLVLFS